MSRACSSPLGGVQHHLGEVLQHPQLTLNAAAAGEGPTKLGHIFVFLTCQGNASVREIRCSMRR